MGMAMEKHGCRSSVLMTSTWHRVAGPMAELMERGRSGAFPVDTFCVFEALESCPEVTQRAALREMPRVPHHDVVPLRPGLRPTELPKAKRSSGHYKIDSLIQKAKAVSQRVFESDYLCLRPKAVGDLVHDVRRGPAHHARRRIRPAPPGSRGDRSGRPHGGSLVSGPATGRRAGPPGQRVRRLLRGRALRRDECSGDP